MEVGRDKMDQEDLEEKLRIKAWIRKGSSCGSADTRAIRRKEVYQM